MSVKRTAIGTPILSPSALGDNIGVPIAVLFTLIVLLGVANGLVRNGEISDTGAVNAIVSCQRASLLSRLIER